jgi:DNA modification methylase
LTATLYNADCLDVLPLEADALISDPPYGIKLQTRNGTRGNTPPHSKRKLTANNWRPVLGDDQPFDPSPWLEYPIVVLWGANYYCDQLTGGMKWLVWDKREAEMQENDNSETELAWTNQKGLLRIHRQLWMGMAQRGEENGKARIHPTQKPVALMAWCLAQVKVPEGATVLDPYMGSGTTGIACLRTGRNFIGIERDAAHYKTACDRIAHELDGALL